MLPAWVSVCLCVSVREREEHRGSNQCFYEFFKNCIRTARRKMAMHYLTI